MNIAITCVCHECGGTGRASDGIELHDGEKKIGTLIDLCKRCDGFGVVHYEYNRVVSIEAKEA